MSAPRLLAPTTISGGVPTAGAGTLNTIALWTPDGNTLGNSLLTQSGSIVTNASGAIRAAGTTQTSPAFTRHDTTTSGIYFPATNEIGFTISNQHAMFISSGRNVGIGTTSPSAQLHISRAGGTSNAEYIRLTNTTVATNSACGITFFQNNAAVPVNRIEGTVSAAGSYDLVSYAWNGSSTAEVMRLQGSTGNVGIGTASPLAQFTLGGAANATYKMGFQSAAGPTEVASISMNSATGEQRITSGFAAWGGFQTFYTNGFERARIDSSGNVGIGTVSPGARLHVTQGASGSFANLLIGSAGTSTNFYDANEHYWRNGTLATGMYMNASGNVGIGTASPASRLHVNDTSTTSTTRNIYTGTITAGLGGSIGLGGYWNGTNETVFAYIVGGKDNATSGDYGGHLQFWTRPNGGVYTERARIDSAGRLLVGTSTAPGSAAVRSVLASNSGVYAGVQNTGTNVGCAFGAGAANFELYTSSGVYGVETYTQRMAVSSAGTAAQSQVAIGTSSFTTGRALTTVADLDVFGVRVGRGGNASIATNTAVGPNALNSGSAGNRCTAVGNNALLGSTGNDNTGVGDASAYSVTSAARVTAVGGGSVAFVTGSDNTAVGANALYGNSGAPGNGSANTAIGSTALNALTSGVQNVAVGSEALKAITSNGYATAVGARALVAATNGVNVAVGYEAGSNVTTGSSNIILGVQATTAAAADSNQCVIGSATYWVGTNGGATTYYATAGALLGYMQIRLNGANVKIPVYAP